MVKFLTNQLDAMAKFEDIANKIKDKSLKTKEQKLGVLRDNLSQVSEDSPG